MDFNKLFIACASPHLSHITYAARESEENIVRLKSLSGKSKDEILSIVQSNVFPLDYAADFYELFSRFPTGYDWRQLSHMVITQALALKMARQ